MKDELFNELLAGVCEGGTILSGEMEPSRAYVVVGYKRKRPHKQKRRASARHPVSCRRS